jgi:hypothetical protein
MRKKRSGFPRRLLDLGPFELARRNRFRGIKSVTPAAVDKPVGQPYLCEA